MTHADFDDLLDYVDTNNVDFVDNWGQPFQYERVSKFQYRLWSMGPDMQDGTEDDLTNWRGDQ